MPMRSWKKRRSICRPIILAESSNAKAVSKIRAYLNKWKPLRQGLPGSRRGTGSHRPRTRPQIRQSDRRFLPRPTHGPRPQARGSRQDSPQTGRHQGTPEKSGRKEETGKGKEERRPRLRPRNPSARGIRQGKTRAANRRLPRAKPSRVAKAHVPAKPSKSESAKSKELRKKSSPQ